jgi:hypothetical protein
MARAAAMGFSPFIPTGFLAAVRASAGNIGQAE